jgi:hypothetical protein
MMELTAGAALDPDGDLLAANIVAGLRHHDSGAKPSAPSIHTWRPWRLLALRLCCALGLARPRGDVDATVH